MTYVFMSIPFLAVAMILFLLKLRSGTPKLLLITVMSALILCTLTIIFDNLMVWADFFGYGDTQHLGIWLGLIPLEDLFYPLFAVLLIPSIWLPGNIFSSFKSGTSRSSPNMTAQSTTNATTAHSEQEKP
ncbi:lycopene cyclase domain-containing protein [Corynebacterium crudilactis]|uniref:C50 carotenoid epsilon cyclase n=1 Tax=Corynebacterium crudilactis TaxID=1652495 RepID=A0A172QRJ3_9CORY|nr:lycopene cyclase domain-containing protein [Corynebacterium crudilactis]ANE03306.1 C50 carotenoid epsilon cyclase [Corynebacterium crudilactis]